MIIERGRVVDHDTLSGRHVLTHPRCYLAVQMLSSELVKPSDVEQHTQQRGKPHQADAQRPLCLPRLPSSPSMGHPHDERIQTVHSGRV